MPAYEVATQAPPTRSAPPGGLAGDQDAQRARDLALGGKLGPTR